MSSGRSSPLAEIGSQNGTSLHPLNAAQEVERRAFDELVALFRCVEGDISALMRIPADQRLEDDLLRLAYRLAVAVEFACVADPFSRSNEYVIGKWFRSNLYPTFLRDLFDQHPTWQVGRLQQLWRHHGKASSPRSRRGSLPPAPLHEPTPKQAKATGASMGEAEARRLKRGLPRRARGLVARDDAAVGRGELRRFAFDLSCVLEALIEGSSAQPSASLLHKDVAAALCHVFRRTPEWYTGHLRTVWELYAQTKTARDRRRRVGRFLRDYPQFAPESESRQAAEPAPSAQICPYCSKPTFQVTTERERDPINDATFIVKRETCTTCGHHYSHAEEVDW